MKIEELKPILANFKPHLIARDTGLCRITVYNILAGKQLHPKPETVFKLFQFLNSQQKLILALQTKQEQ